MRSLALLLVALLASAALAPSASAQATPVPVAFWLSSTPGSVGTLAGVETLATSPPTKADDSLRNITGGAGWYQVSDVPGLAGEAAFDAPVTGTAYFLVTPLAPLPIGVTFQNTVAFELRKLTANGTETFLGNTTADLQVQLTPPISNTTQVNWTIAPPNATLLGGERLVLNISAASTGLGALALQYDSVTHPSGFNLSLVPVAQGNLQLSATTTSRDAAPGSSPTYVVNVRNLGGDPDTVRLNVTGSPADWPVRVNPTQLTLAGGSSGSALVTVTVPAGAADGTRHTATVSVVSGFGGAPQTLVLTTTARGTLACPGDQDCDRYSDVDERRYSSNVNDPNSTPDNTDSDNDGVTNRAEVDAGTDPFDDRDFPGSGDGGDGGFQPGGGSMFGSLGDSFAASTGLDTATGDLLLLLLLLLFLLIILYLIWLLLAAYPVKVSLVEPKAVTEPGRGADYAVEVKSRLGRQQQVDLEAAGLPSDWDVRFNKPHLTLDAKQSETVGMLVRPPDAWPAPTKRDFQVRARSRLKPEKFAQAVAKLLVQPRPVGGVAPPAEEGVAEAGYEPGVYAPPSAAPVPYAPPVAPPVAGGPFRVAIGQVRHQPEVPERGGEVTTAARLDNQGTTPERVRVVLVVNGKVRDEVRVDLQGGEGAEAEFHWVAYLARNEVKVVAERV